MNKVEPDWVVAGGAFGEIGFCERCGEGLKLDLPLPVDEVVAKMKEFCEKHSACQPGQVRELNIRTFDEWLQSREIGISSLTIASVMRGTPFEVMTRWVLSRPCFPYDVQDFRRCYDLLKLFPTWRGRLGEVAAKYPEWEPFVEHWEEMTTLYEEELPTGSCPKLYALMKALAHEAEATATNAP